MAFNWKQRTRDYEKFMPRVYDDGGQKAIGYGSQLASHPQIDPEIVAGKRDMTQAEAEALFSPDYAMAMSHAKAYVGERWESLTGNQKGVITDMAYNMMKVPRLEDNGLAKFETMQKMIKAGNLEEVPAEMMRGTAPGGLSKWAAKVKSRAVADSSLFNAPD